MTSTKGPPDLTEYNYFLYKFLTVCLLTLINEIIRTETAAKSRETLVKVIENFKERLLTCLQEDVGTVCHL